MTTTEPAPVAAASSVAPAATPSVQIDRPPPGLAQGRYAAPPWLVGGVAAAILVAVVAYFVARHRRAKRARVYESVAPQSTPHSSRR